MTTATTNTHGYVNATGNHGQPYVQHTFDTTGQIAPPGMKPRVTATLWEDEGSLCYQVEAKGVCVARREGSFCLTLTFLISRCLLIRPNLELLTNQGIRQSHDQRDQAPQCRWHD